MAHVREEEVGYGRLDTVDLAVLERERPALFAALQVKRREAVNKKLDMTDAFEEYAGTGSNKNLGVMPKNRFKATMGVLFGGDLTHGFLDEICLVWGTGPPDPEEPQTHSQVLWKEFALDFDEIALPEPPAPRHMGAEIEEAMGLLRRVAVSRRLDLSDAFEEYAASGAERSVGVMTKNRFRSTMGTLFRGEHVTERVLKAICSAYGAGDADPREPGTKLQVRWKAFANDFDDFRLPPPPPLPDPTAEIIDAMREINAYCNRNAIDLANDFEEYLGGKDKCSSDLMPRGKFIQALGVLLGKPTSLYHYTQQTLDDICKVYAAGKPLARDPSLFEMVQWREFAEDVNRVQPTPFLSGLQGEVHCYPQTAVWDRPRGSWLWPEEDLSRALRPEQ